MNQLLPARRAHGTSRSGKPALVNSPEEQGTLHCRGCSAGGLQTILDLGCLPLANGLLSERRVLEPEPTYPLILVFCSHCALVQITETLPAVDLYRQYVYFPSYSAAMLCESRRIAERMIRVRQLNQNSRVIEIASNDGYLLQFYKEAGISVLGVEPASNVAAAAIGRGIPTVCDFFSHAIAQQLCEEGKRADVIHAHNVLAHVADIHDFFRGVAMLLEKDGVIAIEVPYVRDMIEGAEFDTIYHEHLSYFSLSALHRIGELHGLAITDVEHLSIHGGSLRIFMAHAGMGAARVFGLAMEQSPAGGSGICRRAFRFRNRGTAFSVQRGNGYRARHVLAGRVSTQNAPGNLWSKPAVGHHDRRKRHSLSTSRTRASRAG